MVWQRGWWFILSRVSWEFSSVIEKFKHVLYTWSFLCLVWQYQKNSWAEPTEVMSCRKFTNPLFPPEAAQLPRSCQLYGGAENCFGEWQNMCVGHGMLLELCISLSVFYRLLFHRFIPLFFFSPEVILYICCSCNICINIL